MRGTISLSHYHVCETSSRNCCINHNVVCLHLNSTRAHSRLTCNSSTLFHIWTRFSPENGLQTLLERAHCAGPEQLSWWAGTAACHSWHTPTAEERIRTDFSQRTLTRVVILKSTTKVWLSLNTCTCIIRFYIRIDEEYMICILTWAIIIPPPFSWDVASLPTHTNTWNPVSRTNTVE